MSEIVCLLFYRATITLTRNIIPHYRWRISHATLPISSNYELANGLVASARFLMYTHLGTGGRIWTYDPRVTSQKKSAVHFRGGKPKIRCSTRLSYAGYLVGERGIEPLTTAPNAKRICCKLPSLDASKYVVLPLHHSPKVMAILHISTIFAEPKALLIEWPFVRLQDSNLRLPPSCERAVRYTKPILRSIVPTHYLPCTAFFSVLSNAT